MSTWADAYRLLAQLGLAAIIPGAVITWWLLEERRQAREKTKAARRG